ncbi:FeMo cofactor biosynthesis protein NifB [Methanobrevibacter cuticularis]|uniref:FeMo cofactor biosynthesis protein NifB n=1 Tax=Methanobrevibacter cuticularis TaxID=47311 RepID=A0A166F7W9_9EURY|nr:NifB/NifX family molybdenum-iron cluster-binding protein [Methanobrevibacter cuticularis]KZX17409.1 FeMo cofactor biosynthesis protein NifB [Methanobrevibacter cuticularis]
MSFKVAIASSDGENVNQHFGKADHFLIFEIDDGNYKFLESRSIVPSCGGEETIDHTREQTMKLISDVKAVLVSNIGPQPIETLIANNIVPYMTSMNIDDALKELISLKKFKD